VSASMPGASSAPPSITRRAGVGGPGASARAADGGVDVGAWASGTSTPAGLDAWRDSGAEGRAERRLGSLSSEVGLSSMAPKLVPSGRQRTTSLRAEYHEPESGRWLTTTACRRVAPIPPYQSPLSHRPRPAGPPRTPRAPTWRQPPEFPPTNHAFRPLQLGVCCG
jgi:hypothetical protein